VDIAGGVVEGQCPLSFVDKDVVVSTDGDEFVHIGLTTEIPRPFAVGIGPRGRDVAARMEYSPG
jgi:hypothetical protein